MSKKKWEKGRQIYSVADFSIIKEYKPWFIVNGKTMHKSFLESMTFRTVEGFIRRGQVFAAVPANEKLLGKSTRSLTTEEFRYADE